MLLLGALWAADARPQATLGTADEPSLSLLEVIALTLEHDPNIAIVESRLESSRGALLSTAGRFDLVVTSDLTASDVETPAIDGSSSDSQTVQGSLGLSQRLRSGLSLEPDLSLSRNDGEPTINDATVSFTIRQPLLRGRGRVAVAAGEMAAQREVEASRLDLAHTIAERLRTALSRYWQTKAAQFNLDVLQTTEGRSRQLLDTTRKLVAADITPAAELVQLEADLVSKEAARLEGERALFAARQDLGRAIGLMPAASEALPLPGDRFPDLTAAAGLEPGADSWLIDQALTLRADLRAARERLGGSQIRQAAAANALEPRLDLIFTPSYSGIDEGSAVTDFFTPIFDNIPGLSASLTLSLAWPTRNRQAQGELIQARETSRQGFLSIDLLERQIGAQVATAIDAVRQNALQLERASEAVRLFEQAVENEEKKLRAGSSTLIDVISQRDRLTAAQQREISAQQRLAQALLDLRFETGTLLANDGQASSIQRQTILTVPAIERP